MLRADLIRPRLLIEGGQVRTPYLPADYHWLGVARALGQIFQQAVGQSRAALQQRLSDYEGDNLDYPIIRGLAAVLENGAIFGNDPAVDPVQLRASLFRRGPATTGHVTREQILAETAAEWQITPAQAEIALFGDLLEEQLLLDTGRIPAPADLIARYNLEVARGVLYWAREVQLWVGDSYKDVFKYIKLFKLMYGVAPAGEHGYHITLFGPISPFVKSTLRYGLQFAAFMPALLLCHQWQLVAEVRPPQTDRFCRYELNDQNPLTGYFKGSGPFDSRLEADFAAEFEARYERSGRDWQLAREPELIINEDSVLIPDFSLTHRDGRKALLEIVGFWHPHYLKRKLEKVRQASCPNLILLVYESANVAEEEWRDAPAGAVLFFKNKPILKEILTALEQCAL